MKCTKETIAGLIAIWALAHGNLQAQETAATLPSDAEAALPKLPEVLALIQEHLPEIAAEDLDRAALQGILTEFQSRIEVVPTASTPEPAAENVPPALTRYYEASIGYIAAPLIDDNAPVALAEAVTQLDSDHLLAGLVLDLRHVSGNDFEPLLAIAGLLAAPQAPLLDWGAGVQSAKTASRTVNVPLVAVIDATTRGAGEVLAAIIRESKLGILVGEVTAGHVHSYQEMALSTGQSLRLATGQISLADGTVLGSDGVQPDIIATPELNASASDDSIDSELPEAIGPGQPLPIPNDDPVLARAIELLKGIGIVERRNRS